MRIMTTIVAATVVASCQAPAQAQRDWPKPVLITDGDFRRPQGWFGSNQSGWSAAQGDPTAPFTVDISQSGKVEGAAALQNALRLAKISGLRNSATYKQKANVLVPGMEENGSWYSGGTVTIGGVEHSVFVSTQYSKSANRTASTLFRTPTKTLRTWGGMKFYAEIFGVSDVFQTFEPKDWASASAQTPANQAKLFADVYDGWIVGMAQQNAMIQQGTLDMMTGINKDWATRASCAASSNCTYMPGGTPGTGRTSYQ